MIASISIRGALAMLALAVASSGAAANEMSVGIHVSAICKADVTMLNASSGLPARTPVGQVNAFCNGARTYTLVALHSPNLQNATFIVDGPEGQRQVPAAMSGETVIEAGVGPTIHLTQVEIEGAGADAMPIQLSMIIN